MIKLTLTLSALLLSSVNAQTPKALSNLEFGPKKETVGKPLDAIIAVVGSDIITQKELNRTPNPNKKQALQRLIMQKLLLQEARRQNITVGDTALNIAINQMKGSKKRVTREQVRNDLIISRLRQKVVNNYVRISDAEVNYIVDKQIKNLNDSVKLIDILIKVPLSDDPKVLNQAQNKTQSIINQLKSLPADVVTKQYSDVVYSNLGWVSISQIPTTFSKVLIDAEVGKYLSPIIDQDGIHILKILDKKQNDKKNTATIRETKARHILIKNSANAKKAIYSAYQLLKQGEDFAKVAETYSEDLGSATKGGDLGWVTSGQMVPNFERVMNNTKVGTLSKPFKSVFGYHIIKVEARRNLSVDSHTRLANQAKQAIFRRKASQAWERWLSQLQDEAHVDIKIKQNN